MDFVTVVSQARQVKMLPDGMDIFGGWQEDVFLVRWLIGGSISIKKMKSIYIYSILALPKHCFTVDFVKACLGSLPKNE